MPALYLTRVRPSDAPDLIAAHLASTQLHLPWLTAFTDQAGFDMWFNRTLAGPNIGLIVRETASEQVVGIINFNEIAMGAFQSAYLSYWGMAGFSGRGLMTQAMQMAVAFAFTDLGLHRLEANIQPGNAASIALVRRVGFKQEGYSERYLRINGEWRDHERWALLNMRDAG